MTKFPGQHAGAKRHKVVTRAEFARALGVTRGAVTKACQPGKRLHGAARKGGIDVLHKAAQAWLAETRRRTVDVEPLEERASGDVAGVGPADLGELGRLTLNELNEQHGNVRELRGFIRARRDLEEARKVTMVRMRVQSALVPVRTVELMIAHVDAAFRLLLTEAPRTIATRLGCADLSAAAALIRDAMSQHLEAAVSHMLASVAANDPLAPIPTPDDPILVDATSAVYGEDGLSAQSRKMDGPAPTDRGCPPRNERTKGEVEW